MVICTTLTGLILIKWLKRTGQKQNRLGGKDGVLTDRLADFIAAHARHQGIYQQYVRLKFLCFLHGCLAVINNGKGIVVRPENNSDDFLDSNTVIGQKY